MKNLNAIYPGMKQKRRSSESKKKGHINVQGSNGTPTPESMMYDSNRHYSKYKEYEKYLSMKKGKAKGAPYHKKSYSSVNPSLDDYTSFNRKGGTKVRTNSGYGTHQVSGGSKSRIEREKRKGSKNTSDSDINYHNSSNDGTYSYEFKGSKNNYKRIHGKSVTANTSPVSSGPRHSTKKQINSINKSDIGFFQSQN